MASEVRKAEGGPRSLEGGLDAGKAQEKGCLGGKLLDPSFPASRQESCLLSSSPPSFPELEPGSEEGGSQVPGSSSWEAGTSLSDQKEGSLAITGPPLCLDKMSQMSPKDASPVPGPWFPHEIQTSSQVAAALVSR